MAVTPNDRPQDTPTEYPSATFDRIEELVEYAYIATQDAAELDLIDFSPIGEPLREILQLLRAAR